MKKTLVIMGTHPSGQKQFDWKRRDCEIWLFNEAPMYGYESDIAITSEYLPILKETI
jgi:hypothetical protein